MRVLGLPWAYWIVWVVVLVIAIGRFVPPLLATYLTTDRELPASSAGLIISVFGVGGVLSSLVGGYLADRYGHVPVVVWSQAASAGALCLIALELGHLALVAVLFAYGFSSHLANPALNAMIVGRVPPQDRERAFTLNTWALNLGFAVGPLCASWVAVRSFSLVFYLEAALLLAAAIVVCLWLGRASVTRSDAIILTVPETLTTLRRDWVFLSFSLTMVALMAVYLQAFTTLPMILAEEGLPVSFYGLLMAMNGGLLCLLSVPFVRVMDRIANKTVLLHAGVLLIGAGYVVELGADARWHHAVAMALWTLAELAIFPVAWTIVSDLAPDRMLGTYLGVGGMYLAGGHVVAAGLGGTLLELVGPRGLHLVCLGVLVLVSVAFGLQSGGRRDREQSGRDRALRRVVRPTPVPCP
ncbi:MFS transporter [Nocardioides houyundeii]|uniref:MFS transporter n=1 Tax=Nocardioides houyundeii TaxID=2045452 RepID=UPI0013B4322C|nr:MFS transporter [Nocardioides houyundeii]